MSTPSPLGSVANDRLIIGKTVRSLRRNSGLTLRQVADELDRAVSYVSGIENGKRDVKLAELNTLARLFGVAPDAILKPESLDSRAGLEVEWERRQNGPLYTQLGLPRLAARKTLSDDALTALIGLHAELENMHRKRAATPEEARRANTALRAKMRKQGNYFQELEQLARELHRAIGHDSGPLSQRLAAELAQQLGFTLHYVGDLPPMTRSVTDAKNMRIFLPRQTGGDPRTVLLQALSAHALGVPEITDYEDFLWHRVRINYLAGALLIDEKSASDFLAKAKDQRQLAVEDLRDHYAVTYETAAHRFTNLATEHLGIPVHFLKANSAGTVYKAYENDGVLFPSDPLGAVEGQTVCRKWSARQVFKEEDRLTPFHQYTDKPNGTYWCTSKIESTPTGTFSLSVGTPFDDVKWFRGRETTRRGASSCPDEGCCRLAPPELASKWEGKVRSQAMMNTALLAAMPRTATPGVDEGDLLEFLEQHEPR